MMFGTIRKRAEVSLHNRIGMGATEEQVTLIRTYAVDVAEGTISLDDAVAKILAA